MLLPQDFLNNWYHGKEDDYYYIPIVSHRAKGDSIIVQKYIDEGLSERQAFHINQLAPQPIVTINSFYWAPINSAVIF